MSNRALRQLLQMLTSAGVTHLPHVELPKPSPRSQPARTRPANPAAVRQPAAHSLPSPNQLQSAAIQPPPVLAETAALSHAALTTITDKREALAKLSQIVANCRRCAELVDSRTQTVFGTGNPDADIMFIGEAPGADEDRAGEPFVGASGQLMDKIISACGLRREEIYICNILRCRPPGNRNPLPQEASNCREYLDAQIKIVNPTHIVCWGTIAAQKLLNETRPVGELRGKFFQYQQARVLCTYHPSYLLRQPAAKKHVWDDMKLFMKDCGIEPN